MSTGPITVVKLGGRTQGAPLLPAALSALWKRTGGRLVIVHGGGDQLSALQRARGEEPEFVGGRRVTTPLVLELVRMVLSGGANKQLVAALTAAGAPAVGISGEDAALLPAKVLDRETFGAVGTPVLARPGLVLHLLSGGFLPVISPVGTNTADAAHGALNVNGDDAAAAIAVALGADELLLMVDVAGVLSASKTLIPQLTLSEAEGLVASGVAGGGMAAKLEACEIALEGGVARVRVGDITALESAQAGTIIVSPAQLHSKFSTPPMTATSMTSPAAGTPGATFAPVSSHTPSPTATPMAGAPAVSAPVIVGTYKRQKPLFVRGEGVHLIDESGKRYLDFVAGIAVNALGHADVGVMNAMHQAMQSGLIHTSNLYRTAPGEELAQWLVDHSFASSVFFCNSGAEANEGAFKFARRWGRANGGPSKFEVIALRGSFHGRLPGTLAATDRPSYRLPFRPLMGGVSIIERDLDELDAALNPETAAAVIVEPIQGEGGVRVLDPGFMRELRAMTRERNVLLILDEIQCGFGRTGTLFAYEGLGIEPDMMTLAKPIAAGLPMGAILTSADVANDMQPGDHGTTFGGGPFVASVALHVVARLAEPAMLEHVTHTGAWLGEQLRAMGERTHAIRDVRGTGFMWGVDVHENAGAIVARAFEKGLLLVTAGDHTLRLLPPLVMTQEQFSEGLAIMEASLTAP